MTRSAIVGWLLVGLVVAVGLNLVYEFFSLPTFALPPPTAMP